MFLAKAEIVENPENKEVKSRKVRSSRHFVRAKNNSSCSSSENSQRRKTTGKPRDTSTPHGTTAAESVRNLLKKNPRYSKKINYAVLDQFFKPEKSSTPDGEEGEEEEGKDEAGLYRIDEKDDGEGEEVVEEGGEYQAPLRDNPDYEDEEDKQDDYGSWEDVFEQEV